MYRLVLSVAGCHDEHGRGGHVHTCTKGDYIVGTYAREKPFFMRKLSFATVPVVDVVTISTHTLPTKTFFL